MPQPDRTRSTRIFTPLTEGFLYADANDFDSVKALAKEHKCAAIMFEPVQGEGGVMPLDKEFLEKTAAFAKENGILLVADEVQTGNGRTGKLYGYMHYNIEPDIFSTAKGLGGGLPIGATVMTGRVASHLTPGTHGSTFGGNPICAAGALTVIERLTDSFLSEVGKKGDYIKSELSGAKGVRSVSGLGLMVGLKDGKERGRGNIILPRARSHRHKGEGQGAPSSGTKHSGGALKKSGLGHQRGVRIIILRRAEEKTAFLLI